ncbi:MAG: hypothetical protein C0404_06090 [Verrucomicrobia bacterium]|nr:hypothetical protein [Verrucomicrobiota bacterium]
MSGLDTANIRLLVASGWLDRRNWEISLFSRPRKFNFATHRHSGFVELTYVRRGSMLHCINGHECRQGRGDLALVRESDMHSLSAGTDLEYANLAFAAEWLKKADQLPLGGIAGRLLTAPGPILGHIPAIEQDSFDKTLQALLLSRGTDRAGAQFAGLLFGVLGRYMSFPGLKAGYAGAESGAGRPAWLERLLARVDSLPASMRSCKEMAALCGRSREHVTRCFRQYLGMSVSEFLIQRRLQHARRILISTDLPVKDVAVMVGFVNVGHFYESFKAEYGVSPGDFRRKNTDEPFAGSGT